MYLDYTPEQRALQTELRALMTRLMTDEVRAELLAREAGGPHYTRVLRALGDDGWLGIGWPTEHGGRGMSAVSQFIFFDEVQRAGFPIPLLTLNTVGPTLVAHGSPEQRQRYLPPILRGECHFSIGYTEPASGTDLASLRTRAERDGDHYVVTGQKIWNSYGSIADYVWLAVRTDPDARRHKGISVLIVPTDAPGVSISPMQPLGDNEVSAMYFEGVRVPVENRVGPENGGWRLITSQLNHERVALMSVGPMQRLAEETRDWAAGADLLGVPWVQAHLGWVDAHLEVLRLLNWQQAWRMDAGSIDPSEASTIKVFGSEMYIEACRRLGEVLGAAGVLASDAHGAALRGDLERFYRSVMVLTFGGGTNEVQRDIIGQVALRLPRAGR